MNEAGCRYCQRRRNINDTNEKFEISSEKACSNFNKVRRKIGACQSCKNALEAIDSLRNNLQTNQRFLHLQANTTGVEPEIEVKLEKDDEDYKDPLICLEPDETVVTAEAYELCDLCDIEFLADELKSHIDTVHNIGRGVGQSTKLEVKDEYSEEELDRPLATEFLETEMKQNDEEIDKFAKRKELFERAIRDFKQVTSDGQM